MITIDLSIYGALAPVAGGKHIAQAKVNLDDSAKVKDLLAYYNINPKDTGYIFINAILCDAPGLNASLNEPLKHNDHVGIFSHGYIWPFQYRHGAFISKSLKKAMKERGILHHTYTNE